MSAAYCCFLMGLISTAPSTAAAQQPGYRLFFGHTVAFKIGTCQLDEKDCKATIQKAIKFDKNGALTEAFMLGDRVERAHVFGKLKNVVKKDSDTKGSLKLGGSGNTLTIEAATTLTFSDGDTHVKTDRFQFSTSDGVTCSPSGSREMVDKPSNRRKVIPIVGDACHLQ